MGHEAGEGRRYFLRPIVALGLTLACYVALQVVAAVLMLALGPGYSLLPAYVAAVVVPVLLITREHSPSVKKTLRLLPVKAAPMMFTVGVCFSFILLQYNIAGLMEKLFPMPSWMENFLLDMTRIRSLSEALRVVSGVVLAAAAAEELLFRGFLQGSLEDRRGRWSAIVLTSLVFAVLHDPWRLVPVFFIGVLLGYLASRGGSVYYSMVGHAVTNGTSVAGLNIFAVESGAEFSLPWPLIPVMVLVFAVSIVGFVRTAGARQPEWQRGAGPTATPGG
ncbi:MAG: CPBP family intramembrane metalloprotease [Candidatus Eisenbacteria bacterium]|nr:CPBP family intramembrane metalloprotease [Candidatus Eisenbacteria bacterium]